MLELKGNSLDDGPGIRTAVFFKGCPPKALQRVGTAMARPEEYKDLMVRISGYNAYFTQLNRDLQLELVRRADYSM